MTPRNGASPSRKCACTLAAGLVLAVQLVASAALEPLKLHLLRSDGAVCNDGSPAGFYYRAPQSSSTASRWLIHLQGGSWCYSTETVSATRRSLARRPSPAAADVPSRQCAARNRTTPTLMSSRQWAGAMEADGVLASPRWGSGHVVFVRYCSSDAWMGDGRAFGGWQFRGKAIVGALIGALRAANFSGGIGHAEDVLLSGCSAGGRGMVGNADYLADLIADSVAAVHDDAAHCRRGDADAAGEGALAACVSAHRRLAIRALFDSAWWLDTIAPAMPNVMPFVNQSRIMMAAVNMRPNRACIEAVGAEHAWQCLFEHHAIPFIRTPFLSNTFQYDAFQLQWNTDGHFDERDPRMCRYAEAFRAAMLDTLHSVLPLRDSVLFAPACYLHCATEDARWTHVAVDGHALADVVDAWSAAAWNASLIARCSGFNCGCA